MLSGVQSTAPAGRGRGSLRSPPTKDSQCQGPGLRRERRSTSLIRSAFFRPWGSALLRTLVLGAPLAEGCAALSAGSASEDRLSEREKGLPAAPGPAGGIGGRRGDWSRQTLQRGSLCPSAQSPSAQIRRVSSTPRRNSLHRTRVTFPVPALVLFAGFLIRRLWGPVVLSGVDGF